MDTPTRALEQTKAVVLSTLGDREIELAAGWLAYANGANDNFKGVATLYGSGAASYKTALTWSTLCTAAGAVGADEIGVAERALGFRAVGFPSRPQVAPGETAEYRGPAGMRPLPLEGDVKLLNRIGHGLRSRYGKARDRSARPRRSP